MLCQDVSCSSIDEENMMMDCVEFLLFTRHKETELLPRRVSKHS